MEDLTPYMEPSINFGEIFIHPTAVIGPKVEIEEGVYIGPHCVIGYPAEWKGKEHINQGVLIKKNTRITGLVTIDSGVERTTTIGENCYLMKHSHVGHDVVLHNDVILSCGVKVGGHSEIGNKTNVGLNAVIHQKINVPEGCMIGASSFVGKKSILKPDHKYVGVPVRELGKNITR
jgi:UDP-N-acetylglucosamine acyltransferase